MSEQREHNSEQDSSPPAAAPATERIVTAPAGRRGTGRVVAWLALASVALLAGLAVWWWDQAQAREASLQHRLDALEAAAQTDAAPEDFEAGVRQIEQRLDERIQALEPRLLTQARRLQQFQTQLEQRDQADFGDEMMARLSRQSTALHTLQRQLSRQDEALARLPAVDHSGWRLAEARYLVGLANQRLLVTGDGTAALAMLRSANSALQQLDTIDMHEVQTALSQNITDLQQWPAVDVDGIYLRLSALLQGVDELVLYQLPETVTAAAPAVADHWRAHLQASLQQALAKLSDYLVIRHRDVPAQAQLTPQWTRLLRQNLKLCLQQAQLALLAGNPRAFTESLEQARSGVKAFFAADNRTTRDMLQEITDLMQPRLSATPPDLSASLDALDQAMTRYQPVAGSDSDSESK